MDPVIATFVILGLAVVAFISGKIPIAIVAIGVPLGLWVTGIQTLPEALSGFGDPTVLFIASLFVVSEALDATGVTAWVGQQVITRAGSNPRRLLVIVGSMAAVLTGFISINGAVAALLPVVVVVAVRAGIVPSKMLIPLAFAASAGSLLTLTGTPVNPVVSQFALTAGGREFGFFEFALVGVPLVALTLLVVATLGPRLVPERSPDRLGAAPDPSEAARSWRESYDVDLSTQSLFSVREGVAEVLVAPRSSLIGRRVWPGMTTREEDLVILAARHGRAEGQNASRGSGGVGQLTLQAGDALLVQGPWAALERYTHSPDVIAVTPPHALRRTVPLGRGARRALVVLGLMVVLLATGIVPPAVAGLLATGALILTRVVTMPQVYRAISWTTVILIAGMVPLSSAFVSTGAADVVADLVLGFTGETSPHLALLVLCVVTILLGQFISNVATVLIVAPIAVSIAATLDLSIQPFMMALTVAGAAAFLTPIATPVNLMVMQPGGYRFGDYWRLGLPLALVFLAVAVLYVPLIWPF
ncbi:MULTISPECIES: SLC13 family permease [unclassified Microbacterium]|uniref:SLC13 family permease n=1 Tax=unclassified Microbacterium TaxID=2609290 RepID=UPI00214BA99A|nr:MULTISPECIES: SLC13 family permease [unclassified Microbacterium]MCR2783343.1 SLC13 family permease [Microbacterium sp. zg.B96]WIM15784.1 SLC13 family permease [Microbacterium sp. zg-B96]